MFSRDLEFCLNEAFRRAREKRNEYMTVEHLLLALLDIPEVDDILRQCSANVEQLRRDLTEFIDQTTPLLSGREPQEVQPTLGFQRVLQRAVFHVQSSGKKEVSPAMCWWPSSARSSHTRPIS
jgi:ATP-dependent Clp protease ATP-binding subunit ClpA